MQKLENDEGLLLGANRIMNFLLLKCR